MKRFFLKIKNWLFGKRKPDPTPQQPPIILIPSDGDWDDLIIDPNVNYRSPNWDYIAPKLKIDKDAIKHVYDRCLKIHLNKHRFVSVSIGLGGKIPWEFIAALTERESSLDFRGVLHNGERILGTGRKTKLIPKGRGPFETWEEAAIDALKIKGYHEQDDWSFADCLRKAERFNGIGYRSKIGDRGVIELSPYVVAYTNYHDENSKYWQDGKYSPTAPEKQLGIAAILIGLKFNE